MYRIEIRSKWHTMNAYPFCCSKLMRNFCHTSCWTRTHRNLSMIQTCTWVFSLPKITVTTKTNQGGKSIIWFYNCQRNQKKMPTKFQFLQSLGLKYPFSHCFQLSLISWMQRARAHTRTRRVKNTMAKTKQKIKQKIEIHTVWSVQFVQYT